MRRILPLGLAFLALSFSSAAQSKHPFTFDDMMRLKRVGDPQVSPDGKWVIFSVVDVDLAANTKTPHIWIVRVGAAASSAAAGRSPAASSAARILIADQDADRPRWAPDGKRFAFLSTKEGGSQVWIADFDGAAGTVSALNKLTRIATEAGGELWSPEGERIIFTSDVFPECDGTPVDEDRCNAYKLDEANKSKVKAQVFTHLLYRHWNAYKEGKRTHIFAVPSSLPAPVDTEGRPLTVAKAPVDLTPGDYDAPVFSLGGQDDYAFSPDGKEICYASNHDKNPAASTNNDLWIVPIAGGPAKNITADNPASDTSPLYSPDGRYIAYRAQHRPGYESDRFRLMLYDRKTGEKTDLISNQFDRWVGTYIWAPDASRLYFVAEDRGTSPINSVSFKKETSSEKGYDVSIHQTNVKLDAGLISGFNDDLALTRDGKTLIFTRMSLFYPNEILVAQINRLPAKVDFCGYGTCPAGMSQLTNVNGEVLSHVALSPFDDSKVPKGGLGGVDDPKAIENISTTVQFWFTGAHNDKVQGFLVKPPNFDPNKKYPVKFLIHGGPQGAWGDDWSYRWNPELFASPTSTASSGYVVIMINFHGSTGYGQKFIDAINGDWGGAPYEDLMKGLDYAEQTYPFVDKTRECALGASYGGYAINWILGHTDRFKCLVSHDGMFNAESAWGSTEEMWFNNWEFKGTPYDNRESYVKWSPHQYAKNFKTPTLVIHGQRDYRLDVSEGFQLFTTLQMQGVPSKMLYFPDEGHWVLKPQNSQLWYKTVNDWVDRWIGK